MRAEYIIARTRQSLVIYWELARIVVPVTIATEALLRLGVIKALAPALAPLMGLFGLPPELGLAWLTCLLVGLWGAVPMIFVLAPVTTLTTADITVFSSLMLFAHALPIEQKIIQRAGPGMLVTSVLRLAGGMIYAFLLHRLLQATGWLSDPVAPAWLPMGQTQTWAGFLLGLCQTMLVMLVILVGLFWSLELLKRFGIMRVLMALLAPILRLTGIRGEAGELTSVGLFLGISYGGGLLIREARSGAVPPRQVFLSCVFMGFAHSIIEDTALVMALGADIWGVLVGRVIFAIAATALIAAVLRYLPNDAFDRFLYRAQGG